MHNTPPTTTAKNPSMVDLKARLLAREREHFMGERSDGRYYTNGRHAAAVQAIDSLKSQIAELDTGANPDRIIRIPITSREQWLAARKQDVTASVAGALLGVHEYQTPFSLWALKSGRVTEDPMETPAMQRGRLLEPVAEQLIFERFPDLKKIEGNDAYFRNTTLRIGATPDLIVDCPERGRGIIQIKSVGSMVFRLKWRPDKNVPAEPPVWIGIQALVEAYLTGARWAQVAALVVDHGLELHMVDVPLIPELLNKIKNEVSKFWSGIDVGVEPDPDFRQDESTINSMFSALNPCIIDLKSDNALGHDVDRLRGFKKAAIEAEKNAKTINNEIMHKVVKAAGKAGVPLGPDDPKPRIAMADGRKIGWVSFTRKPYEVGEADVSYLRMPTKDKE